MARTAVIRSASLSPREASLADRLAQSVAGGSFTELVRMFLLRFGDALERRMVELRESGIDPNEVLFVTHPTPPNTDAQIEDFYRPSTWPEKWAAEK